MVTDSITNTQHWLWGQNNRKHASAVTAHDIYGANHMLRVDIYFRMQWNNFFDNKTMLMSAYIYQL